MLLLVRGCNSSPSVTPILDTATAPIRTYVQDSLKIRQQELLIVQSQGTIEALQDSIERITEKITNVVPQYLIRYRDTTIIRTQVPLDTAHNVLSPEQKRWLDSVLVLRSFSDSTKWYTLEGSLSPGTLRINRLELYNKTSVIIGQKGSWWQPKTVVVNVVQENPYLVSANLQSYYYKPKERKWSLVVGPSLLFNGKSFYKGVAVTAGYKLW